MAALHKFFYPVCLLFGALASANAQAAELTVQIGAFGDRPNPAFAERAAEYGELLVLRGDDGITRVSIGRYNNKVAAREALQRLQIAGYTDAYIANVRGRGTDMASDIATPTTGLPAAPAVRIPQTATRSATPPASSPAVSSDGPNPRLATTPKGRPIVAPKQPATDTDSGVTQAGRFRLRTHDTQSGKTSDVKLANSRPSGTAPTTNDVVVTGLGVNEIPQHLREKLVYLDGVPHIKDGDRFIPLTDAVDNE